jgi:hypothetical protein
MRPERAQRSRNSRLEKSGQSRLVQVRAFFLISGLAVCNFIACTSASVFFEL